MTYPAALLPDLLVGWQKVADRYKIPIYVFPTVYWKADNLPGHPD